jgi:hypothetical protein
MRIKLIIILLVLSGLTTESKPMNMFLGLRPGKSTEQDVLRVLGKPQRIFPDARLGASNVSLLSYDELLISVALSHQKVAVIMVGAPENYKALPQTLDDGHKSLGLEELILKSTDGKNHHLYVFGMKGVALTVDLGHVSKIEFFTPMPASKFKKTFYRAPGPFIR